MGARGTVSREVGGGARGRGSEERARRVAEVGGAARPREGVRACGSPSLGRRSGGRARSSRPAARPRPSSRGRGPGWPGLLAAPRPLHSAGLRELRWERDPEAAAAAVSEPRPGVGPGVCGDPGGRDASEGGGTGRCSGSARCAALSRRARPLSTVQRPPPGARVLRLEGALLAPARRVLPGRLEEHMVGVPGGPAAGPGWEEGLQDFPLVKRDWEPSHTYLDPRARVTARTETRFLRDPSGAPQSLSYPVLLNFPACSSKLSFAKKGLVAASLSPWPSWSRQVVPERPPPHL